MADPVLDQLDALEKSAKDAGNDDIVKAVTKLRTEYEGSKDPKQKEAVAKAIPDITKGTLAAINAFREKPPDAIGGSAAILDILSGVSSALGPEGAVLGALFSMVSMILGFFEPKQPSLISQIENLLRKIEGEKEEANIRGASNDINDFATVCEEYMTQPPGPNDHQHNGIRDPGALTVEIHSLNLTDGPTKRSIWDAQNWLKNPDNVDVDAWPDILNLHCEVYARLRMAITRAYIYAFDKDGKGTDGKTRSERYIDEPNGEWKQRAGYWRDLQDELDPKFRTLILDDVHTQDFLNVIVPVARKRGLYVMHWDQGDVAVATGPKAFKENKVKHLAQDYISMAITPPRGGVTDAKGPYDAWLVGMGHELCHRKFDAEKLELGEQEVIHESARDPHHRVFLDCWPVPVSGAPNRFKIPTVLTFGTGSALHIYDWDSVAKTFVREDTRSYREDMWAQVRVATPAAPLPDDPDKDAMPAWFLAGNPIMYAVHGGGGDGFDKQIRVWGVDGEHDVPATMHGCYGIAVDPHFLWMYGRDGFVCTSHASVMSCIRGRRPAPQWLGNGQPRPIPGGHVLALSSCEDGTLFVLAAGDQAKTARYHIDFKNGPVEAGWLVIDGDWETIIGAGGIECQKLPVFGWQRVEALATLLSQQKSK